MEDKNFSEREILESGANLNQVCARSKKFPIGKKIASIIGEMNSLTVS